MKEKLNAILQKINFQKNWKIYVAALVGVAVLVTAIVLLAGGANKDPEVTTPEVTTPEVTTPDNTPVAKD